MHCWKKSDLWDMQSKNLFTMDGHADLNQLCIQGTRSDPGQTNVFVLLYPYDARDKSRTASSGTNENQSTVRPAAGETWRYWREAMLRAYIGKFPRVGQLGDSVGAVPGVDEPPPRGPEVGSPGVDKKPAPRRRSRKNPERDDFMLRLRKEGKKYKEIREEVNKVPGWARLKYDQSVIAALKRLAGIEPEGEMLPPRKRGRPTGSKDSRPRQKRGRTKKKM